MDSIVTWLARWIHVVGAAFWVGGYSVMALVVVPALAREPHESVRRLALVSARVLSFSGALTLLSGLFLVTRSRGYGSLLAGEWGGIVISSAVLALALGAIGDAGLRPAIRRLGPEPGGSAAAARRWALAGLLIGILAIALMTRAIYARN